MEARIRAVRVVVIVALALAAIGCSKAPAATVPACGSGVTTLNCAPTVNGRRVDQARSCDSIVGQVLTKADETTICTLPDGTVETPNVSNCANGQTYINFGLNPSVSGLEGQTATKQTEDWALDRTSCVLSPYTGPTAIITPTPEATPAPSVAAGSMCILEMPAQMGTDMTPITMVLPGADSAKCAQYLAQQNAGQQPTPAAIRATTAGHYPDKTRHHCCRTAARTETPEGSARRLSMRQRTQRSGRLSD